MDLTYEEFFNYLDHFGGILTADGTVSAANDTILEFTGSEKKEVIGKKLWEVPGVRFSETTQRQVRTGVRRAANNEYVKKELTIQGRKGATVIDFSLQPLTNESGEVTHILAEGYDTNALNQQEMFISASRHGGTDTDMMVTYTRDADESMSQAILNSFFAINIDVFEKNKTLVDQIETDALNGFDWGSNPPHILMTRLWGYRVEVSSDEVRIFNDSSDDYKFNP
jgi:PAS domain S-box-containing protein